MPTLTIDGVEYTVLRGDPDKVTADPHFDSIVVMRVVGENIEISDLRWSARLRRWMGSSDSTLSVPSAALRAALLPEVSIVTSDNGRVWSVHSTPEAAVAEHDRAAAAAEKAVPGSADFEFYASGVEHHEVKP